MEQWHNKLQKWIVKNLVLLYCICVWTGDTGFMCWEVLESFHCRECLCEMFLDITFFFIRPFILLAEKSATFRRKRDWFWILYLVFIFSVFSFWAFCFEVRGGLKQGVFIFLPLIQTCVSASCFFNSASKASLRFYFLSKCRFLNWKSSIRHVWDFLGNWSNDRVSTACMTS